MRKATNRLYEMLVKRLVTHEQVVDMCLGAMSEDDVAEMMDNNELSERFDEVDVNEEDENLEDDIDDDLMYENLSKD